VNRSEIRTWALRGAERRLVELAEEQKAIYAAFPELRGASSLQPANPNPYSAGVRQAIQGAVTRRRPKLSAEARRRIAEAQRKRWAAWKAKQGKAEKGDLSEQASAGSSHKKR
jgi:hypothetical protein